MTVLIAGAGMVGSLAATRLVEQYGERPVLYDVAFSMDNVRERVPLDKVTLVRGDVNDLPDLVATMQRHKVDRVLNTVGMLTWMVRERPYAGVRVNLLGLLSTLEAARLVGARRLVFCSSSTVWAGLKGRSEAQRTEEDFTLRAVSEYPPSVYASMKLAGEWLGHSYRNEYGVDFAAVRFAGVFGPWRGTPSGGPSQVMQRLIEGAWRGDTIQMVEEEIKRPLDYVYAADAAQGAVRALMAERLSRPVYNLGMGRNYAVPEVVELIQEYSGKQVDLEVVPGRSVSGYPDPVPPADNSAAQSELGWKIEYPMDGAIKDYLQWLERQG
jgi:UDP-glucose 4-epimerase